MEETAPLLPILKKISLTLNGTTLSSSSLINKDLTIHEDVKETVPLLWERMANGYRIADLCSDRFQEALELTSNHFFLKEPMCLATSLFSKATSNKSYSQYILDLISNLHSVCAIQEGTSLLVGLAVIQVCSKDHTEDIAQPYQGEAFNAIMTLKKETILRANIYQSLNIDKYLCVHVLCVDSSHTRKGIGMALLRSCISRTQYLLLPACVGIFSSNISQRIAKRLGFEMLQEILYEEYKIQENNESPFKSVNDNNSVMCMALKIEIPEIPVALDFSCVPRSSVAKDIPKIKGKSKGSKANIKQNIKK